MEFRPNPLDDDVTGRVVVFFFRGLQSHTVDKKSTRRDVIIERIRSKFHSLEISKDEEVHVLTALPTFEAFMPCPLVQIFEESKDATFEASKSKLLPNPARRSFSFAHGGSSGRETLGSDPEGKKPLEKPPENPPENQLEISYTGKSKKIASLDMS